MSMYQLLGISLLQCKYGSRSVPCIRYIQEWCHVAQDMLETSKIGDMLDKMPKLRSRERRSTIMFFLSRPNSQFQSQPNTREKASYQIPIAGVDLRVSDVFHQGGLIILAVELQWVQATENTQNYRAIIMIVTLMHKSIGYSVFYNGRISDQPVLGR